MKKSGLTKPELEAFFREILDGKNKTGIAFCSDDEGVCIDGVIAAVLISNGHNGLFDVLLDRYRYRKSKRLMAEQLQKRHPEWCYMTCRRRIDSWLSLAEFMLYAPMCDAFGTNSSRFKLQCEPEGA